MTRKAPAWVEHADAPAPGTVCPNCHREHDQELCQDHKVGDPPTQCKRMRPKGGDWCWAHLRARRPSPGGTTIADLDAQEAKIASMATKVNGLLPPDVQIAVSGTGAQATAGQLVPTTSTTTTSTPGAGVGSRRADRPLPYVGGDALHGRPRPTLPASPDELKPIFDPSAQPVDNPVLTLSRVAGVLYSAFEAAGQRVNALSSISVETRAGGEQLRGEIVLWEKLLGHLRVVLVDMAKLNLDERLVRLEEVRADRVAEALFWLLGSLIEQLALSTPQQDVASALMRTTVQRIVTMGTALESVPTAPVTP